MIPFRASFFTINNKVLKKIIAAALSFDMGFWLFLSASIVFLALLIHLYTIYSHLSEYPTPSFLPIFGHIFDYINLNTALKKLTNNVTKHGGVIRQFIGPRKASLLVANKDFLQVLCSNSKYVCKSKYYRYLKPWLGEGLITSDGAKWLSRRKALTGSFTQTYILKDFIEVFEKNSNILIEILEKCQQQDIDIHPIMKKFTLDVICQTAMGISMNSQLTDHESAYAQSIEVICEVIQNRMTSFFKNYDFFFQFSQDCAKEKFALAVVDCMLQKIIAKKNKERDVKKDKKKDMLDLLMELRIDGKMLTSEDLREELNTFLFAGYDTTSSAMSLALYEIGRNPDVQTKLFDEQIRIFECNSANPVVTYEKLQEMQYLDMVIKETLRLHTIVPSVGKKVIKDLKYKDKLIPNQLNISVFIHGFHHNPTYFPDPDKFRPERFSAGNNIEKLTYIPFGVKPRQCLGKNFATLEMKSTLSKIIRNFEIGNVPWHELKMLPKLVLFSSSGIYVTLKRRSNAVNIS